jgi:hypothetical protein
VADRLFVDFQIVDVKMSTSLIFNITILIWSNTTWLSPNPSGVHLTSAGGYPGPML